MRIIIRPVAGYSEINERSALIKKQINLLDSGMDKNLLEHLHEELSKQASIMRNLERIKGQWKDAYERVEKDINSISAGERLFGVNFIPDRLMIEYEILRAQFNASATTILCILLNLEKHGIRLPFVQYITD